MDKLTQIFQENYLKDISEKEKEKESVSLINKEITERKRNDLRGMEYYLNKFKELEVYVNSSKKYDTSVLTSNNIENEVLFDFKFIESSKSWSPGYSIKIEHPAVIEIAIPNNIKESGVIIINVSTHHPYSWILERKFFTFEESYEAISKFLSKSTVSIKKEISKEDFRKNNKQNNRKIDKFFKLNEKNQS